jgi:hypothetical protein
MKSISEQATLTESGDLGQLQAGQQVAPSETGHTSQLATWWQADRRAVIEALTLFVSTGIAFSIIAVLATAFLPEQTGLHSTYHRAASVWPDVLARWDSEYYIDIAAQGYAARPELITFFPLYPLLISTFAAFLGDYVLSGVVISAIAYFVALLYMFKLVAWEFSETLASRALLYLALYPMAFFLLSVYTESLFLAVTIAAFYYARKGEWVIAGVAAFLATVTRPNGFIIVVPLVFEIWRQIGGKPGKVHLAHIWALLAAPIALTLWAAYLSWVTGDPLAIVHSRAQPPFVRVTAMPWETLWSAIQYLGTPGLSPLSRVVNSLDLAATLLLIEATVIAWWRLPRSYAAYMTVSVFLLLASTVPEWPLQSMQRYTLSIFPIFMLLAQLGANRYWHRTILVASAPLLGMYTALFATWYWVF